jgi:deazaflavin-dependent oxidoreductase (nitroreductase family)
MSEATARDRAEEVCDSPVGWVAEHIHKYVESGGARGHRWSGKDTLLLITRGRKTGKLRRTALIYGRDGERFVVVGSNGGKARHPLWYLNLLADSRVRIQVKAEVFVGRARPASDDEKPALWEMMVKIFPAYAGFQRKTRREIPVVVVEHLKRV